MPQEARLLDHLYIRIDGEDLPTEIMDDLIEVSVETDVRLPDMFRIWVHDETLQWIDEGPFELGAEVEVAAVPEEGGGSQPLMKGEITALEPEFGEGTHATLLVRGYDRSHRLHRGSHSKAYVQMTDSDLAEQIADDSGLQAQVDPTSEVHEHILQHNQSHMEFMTQRARRIGYEFYVQESTLYFKEPAAEGETLELEWGHGLKSFFPRLTLLEQVSEVIVQGWDEKNHEVITGQATQGNAEPQIGLEQNGGQAAEQAFEQASRVVVDRHVKTQSEADDLAQSILDEISGAYVEAEGQCYGQPELRAGRQVQLRALGSRFGGSYHVTSATHTYRADEGYTTRFAINGHREETLPALLERSADGAKRFSGPVVAIVTNNKDPEGRARVKVKYPWLSDEVESGWARLLAPVGGADRGVYWLPEVNDEVLVGFEHGDVGRPYVLGGLWNGQDDPPLATEDAVQNGDVQQRVLKTREGHQLLFVDGSESEIRLETAEGHQVSLQDGGRAIKVETSQGQIVTLDDSSSEVNVESNGNLTLKSGANLTIEAGANLELKGATFTLNGDANGEVKAGATLSVQGAMVKIN